MHADTESDDDYEHVSDQDLSDWESDVDGLAEITPSTSPSSSTPRPEPRVIKPQRKILKCEYTDCPKTFNRKARLEEHLNSHKNKRNFRCPSCGKDYLRETHLKHHIKNAHTTVRDYQCTWPGCNKSFATGTRMRRHEATHLAAEQFKCRGYEGCSATFRKRETLAKHVAEVHSQTAAHPYQCRKINVKTSKPCLQTFVSLSKLEAHQRSKHDDTKFACSECLLSLNTTLADNGSATIPEVTCGANPENEETSQSSPSLAAYFQTYAELQVHIAKVHPPTCDGCGHSFKTAKEFERHSELGCDGVAEPSGIYTRPMSTATPKRFQCTYPDCGMSFTKSGNLNVHTKTVHENRRDFICGETEIEVPDDAEDVLVEGCGRNFTSMAGLKDHVRSAHYGLESKQVQRKKRKAEASAANEPVAKLRKPRKDKGTKKSTALSSLTGLSTALRDIQSTEAGLLDDPDSDEENNNFLSGSMTLLDDQLFHYGSRYDIESPEYLSNSTSALIKPESKHELNMLPIDPKLTEMWKTRTNHLVFSNLSDPSEQALDRLDFEFDLPLVDNPYFYQPAE